MNKYFARHAVCVWVLFLFATTTMSSQIAPLKTIEFETTQVTSPDVVLTPDGQQLVFTMLGKLFRMPVGGGTAEQLTFGPYYDSDPAISQDGKLVAFRSDRDGSEGNIFTLDLGNKDIRQITREEWAIRPAWAADGKSVLYIRLERKDWVAIQGHPIPPGEIKSVGVNGLDARVLRPKALVGTSTYLSDGRLVWSVLEVVSGRLTSRIEAPNQDGTVETIGKYEYAVDRIIPNKTSGGFLIRRFSIDPPGVIDISLVSASGSVTRVMQVSSESKSFAVAPDGSSLYAGNKGHLWKVSLPGGQMSPIPLKAKVQVQIRPMTEPRAWKPVEPGETRAARAVLFPTLLPDGKGLIFSALGEFWHQPADGTAPRKITNDGLTRGSDVVISPNGKELAYTVFASDKQRIDVMDISTRAIRTVAPESSCEYEQLSWSLNGQLIVSTACEHEVLAIDPASGTSKVIAKRMSGWGAGPHLSEDGKTLILQAQMPDSKAAYYRLALTPDAKPEIVRPAAINHGPTNIAGDWIVESVPNSTGIRFLSISDPKRDFTITEADGREFSLTADAKHIVYSVGDRVWQQPIDGSARKEIPVRLRSTAPTPRPVLIERIRLLDFNTGAFGPETSVFLSNGRIKSIGPVRRQSLPENTTVINAEGRYAIPGLFDMHGHLDTCGGPSEIAYGVTSVRNMGGRIEQLNSVSDASDFTDRPLPRCFQPGRILEGSQGGRNEDHFFVYPKDEDDARRYVRRANEQGAHFIKLYRRLPWRLQRAASDEAHRLGLPVAAHADNLELSVKGLTLGYAGLTHFVNAHEDFYLMMQKSGAHWDPTLGTGFGRPLRYREDPVRHKAFSSNALQFGDLFMQGAMYERLKSARSAYRLGIPIVPGTDTGGSGIALQWELEFLEEARIPTIDVLRAATIQSAKVLGADRHLGSIEVGKLADLVLLDADPLKDIRNAQKTWRVFKGGWLFDPKELIKPN